MVEEGQFKSLQNSSSIYISDAQTHIDLNIYADKIMDDIKEISLPRRPIRRDKAYRAAKHADDSEKKGKHMAEIEKKFKEHFRVSQEKNMLRHEHLEILQTQER